MASKGIAVIVVIRMCRGVVGSFRTAPDGFTKGSTYCNVIILSWLGFKRSPCNVLILTVTTLRKNPNVLRIDYGDDRVVGSGFTKTGISQL